MERRMISFNGIYNISDNQPPNAIQRRRKKCPREMFHYRQQNVYLF